MAIQTWPLVMKVASTILAARAPSISTSGATRAGSLPPNSRTTGVSPKEAPAITARPVGTPPVNETMSTSGWATRAAPSSGPGPLTALTTPGGRAWASAAVTARTAPGQVGGAFTTTVFPVSRAGRILLPRTETGQLKGRTQATTP